MKLTYRGVTYDYNPPVVEYTESDNVGTYRGVDIRFRSPKKRLVLDSNLDLKYRGVAYQPTVTMVEATPETAPVAAPAVAAEPVRGLDVPVTEWARGLMMRHCRAIKNRQQALLSRSAMEVGMGANQVANYWGRIQGKIHPTFRTTYDRSAVSLS